MAGMNLNRELMEAVSCEYLERVQALLSAGADVNCTDAREDTPLHLSTSVEVTKELLLRGARVRERNYCNETPLISAVKRECRPDLVRLLIEHGEDVRDADGRGNTALIAAVKQNSHDLTVVEELLKHGSETNTEDLRNVLFGNLYSPLDEACIGGTTTIIKYVVIKNFEGNYRKYIPSSPENNWYLGVLSRYLNNCAREVLQMKTHMINKDHSLYEMVSNYLRAIPRPRNSSGLLTNISPQYTACSNLLCIKLKQVDFSMQYPLYKDLILDTIQPFFEKAALLDKLDNIQIYTSLKMSDQVDVKNKKVILNSATMYHLADYLSKADLSNFMAAYDVPSKRPSSLSDRAELDTSHYAKRARLTSLVL